MVNIVTVNVTQTIAPAPSTLQRTGAFISQGATTTAAGSTSLLTQLADLAPILKGALANSTLVWASNVVTVTTAAPHGFTTADTLQLTIAGATPAGYNGTFLCAVTGASTFTYPLSVNPGTMTVPGSYTPEDVAELLAMATTFFSQGSAVSIEVLELGAGNAADGVTALTAFIIANPNTIYSYLVPRPWAAESTFVSMMAQFESTTAKTYFFITATLANYTSFTALMKCAIVMIEAPGIPALEFSQAAAQWVTLNYNPSSSNRVTPTAFSFLFGVTPYPTKGNSALLSTLKTAGVNVVGTGAEGGISNTILLWGTTMDGHDFTYWYSVDWVQINSELALANEIINGSNNPLAPLYFNQNGINRLQAREGQTMGSAISFGLALGQIVLVSLPQPVFIANFEAGLYAGQVVINAIPFPAYNSANPSDYSIGKYAGLSVVYTPARGFIQIIVNVNVTSFVGA
jgi:hypothetical protein